MRVHVVCGTCDSKYWITSRAQTCQFACRKCKTLLTVAAAEAVVVSGKCPSCGGPLGSNEADSCEYCGIALPSRRPSSGRAAPETIPAPLSTRHIATCAIIGVLSGLPAIYLSIATLLPGKPMSTTTTIVVSAGLLAFVSTIMWLLARLPLLAIAVSGITGIALALKPFVMPATYTSGATTRTAVAHRRDAPLVPRRRRWLRALRIAHRRQRTAASEDAGWHPSSVDYRTFCRTPADLIGRMFREQKSPHDVRIVDTHSGP